MRLYVLNLLKPYQNYYMVLQMENKSDEDIPNNHPEIQILEQDNVPEATSSLD